MRWCRSSMNNPNNRGLSSLPCLVPVPVSNTTPIWPATYARTLSYRETSIAMKGPFSAPQAHDSVQATCSVLYPFLTSFKALGQIVSTNFFSAYSTWFYVTNPFQQLIKYPLKVSLFSRDVFAFFKLSTFLTPLHNTRMLIYVLYKQLFIARAEES